MILVVSKDLITFDKVESDTFASLNIWERKHVQEWIRQAPEVLGEELLVVSIEFDRFTNSSDRLDILAIDRMGNIVVVELKRDSYAGYADLQSIRYAAMVSSMTIEKLLPYYTIYQKKYLKADNPLEEQSRANIEEFVSDDNFKELSNTPRIIICSEDFSQEITTTVLWLNSNGLDISCVRIKPHPIGERVAIVPTKIIPLQETQQYLIDVRKKEVVEKSHRKVRPRTMKLLIENGIIKEGDKIYLKNAVPEYLHSEKEDSLFVATITGKLGQSNSIKWDHDNKEYAISALTWQLFKKYHPEGKDPGGINGNWHWVIEKGRSLWDLAQEYWLENQPKA
jgi:hypothetical protein